MTLLLSALVSPVHVLSRSSLNLIDRYIFGVRNKSLPLYFYLNTFLPMVMGIIILGCFGYLDRFSELLLSVQCVALAASVHFVSFCFCLSIKRWEVRQVAMQSKVADLFLPFLVFLIPTLGAGGKSDFQWEYVGFIVIGWLGLLPLFISQRGISFITDKIFLLFLTSLLVEVVVSDFIQTSHLKGAWDSFAFAISLLLWRSCFSLVPSLIGFFPHITNYASTLKSNIMNGSVSLVMADSLIVRLVFLRATIVLLVQFTFVICIATMNPLILWPILNSTSLVSVVLAKIVLKEKISWQEFFAIVSLSYATALPMFLL